MTDTTDKKVTLEHWADIVSPETREEMRQTYKVSSRAVHVIREMGNDFYNDLLRGGVGLCQDVISLTTAGVLAKSYETLQDAVEAGEITEETACFTMAMVAASQATVLAGAEIAARVVDGKEPGGPGSMFDLVKKMRDDLFDDKKEDGHAPDLG